jgi:hypothetical protein
VPVPYRHIYYPVRNELEICCFKQDICIYNKLFDKAIKHKQAKIIAGDQEILTIVLNKNSKNNTQDIGLPFVTIETKMSNTNTDGLLSCSEKVEKIKMIFPYCITCILCFGNCKRNVYRHCSGFDEIFFLENLNDDKCADIVNTIHNKYSEAYGNMILSA